MDDQQREMQIRTRAYELWERDASPEGRADYCWDLARRQVEAEGGTGPGEEEPPTDQSAERDPDSEMLQDAAPEAAPKRRRRA